MPEVDDGFLESLQRELEERKKSTKTKNRFLMVGAILLVLVALGGGAWYFVEQSNETRVLPPELPPPSPQPTLPVSEKAKETGKGYYVEHVEIQSALAEYARRILKGELDVHTLGPSFQPVAGYTWEKWYYDTIPAQEGFKTLKDPKPTPHSYTEDHPMIAYTITPDDKWGPWGVGIKYAAALGIDVTNPADKEIASLVAAYVWLQAENRLLYEKGNYFDDKGNYDPKRPKLNINLVHAGDQLRFPHLSEQALKELGQNPQKYLEGTAPSVAPVPPPSPGSS